jgi:hypothetical protein
VTVESELERLLEKGLQPAPYAYGSVTWGVHNSEFSQLIIQKAPDLLAVVKAAREVGRCESNIVGAVDAYNAWDALKDSLARLDSAQVQGGEE